MAVGQGWVEAPRDVTAMAGAAAERALLLDPLDARAVAVRRHREGDIGTIALAEFRDLALEEVSSRRPRGG